MKKFYTFLCIKQQEQKTKVAFITFTMMLFTTMTFAQTQEAVHSNRNGKVLMAKEQSYQRTNSETVNGVDGQKAGFSTNGHFISLRDVSERNATPSFNLGNRNNILSATGECGKGAVDAGIDQVYGNLNTYTFADDFVVAPHENFYLEELEFFFLKDYTVGLEGLFLTFYEDSNGSGPGIEIPVSIVGAQNSVENFGAYYDENGHQTDKDMMLLTITFPSSIEFSGGMDGASYWAGVRISHSGSLDTSTAAVGTSTMSDSQTFYVNRTGSWEMNTDAYQGMPEQDLILGFYGQCEEVSVYVYENGNWTPEDPSGITTDADDIIIVNGTATLTANTNVNNLTIEAGATLKINNVLNLHGDLTIDGDLVFVSNASGNGELGELGPNATISGEATVQSYMSNNRSYRMVSSAVTTTTSIHANWQEGATSNTDNPAPGFGTHITGSTQDQENGFDRTATGNPSMFIVPPGAQAFEAVANTDVNTLNAGAPYLLFVRGDRSIDLTLNGSSGETVLRAKGTLHTGQDIQDFDNMSMNAGEFLMFGNPYQSTVNINTVLAGSNNLNNNFYYVYDPSLAAHGAYVTVNLPAGTNTGTSAANEYLQPGQGAQFATLADGISAVVFNESDKAPGDFTTTSVSGNRLFSDNMLIAQLFTTENFNNGGPVHDSFGILFDDSYDNAITPEDAIKPMNFYENLAIDHDGTYLSLERREMPQPGEVHSLYNDGYAHTDYTLKMIIEGLESAFFYLDDQFTGTSTLLESGETAYAFSVDTNDELSIATDRFSIRTEASLGVNNNYILAGIRLFPNPLNNGTFYIHAPKLNGEQISVSISDLSGRQIFENTLDCRANTVTVSVNDNLASGIYLVTLRHSGEENTYRLVKR